MKEFDWLKNELTVVQWQTFCDSVNRHIIGVRARAFDDAAQEVYSSGWNDATESGSLRDHSQRLKDILHARSNKIEEMAREHLE